MSEAHTEEKETPAEHKIAQEIAEYLTDKPAKLAKKIKALEKQMYNYAQNLEFEKAAEIRDQIHYIQKIMDK